MAEGGTNAQGSSSVTKLACSYSEVTLNIEPHLDVYSRGSDNSSDYYVSFTLTPAYGKSLPDGILRVGSIGVIRDLGDAGTAIEQVAGYVQPIPASDTPYTFISQPISNCIGIGTVSSCSFGDSMLTDVKEYGDFKFNSSSLELDKKIDGCFNAVGLGSDGKSLDFTAVDGQVNNIAIPSSSEEWTKISNLSDIDIAKIKVGSKILIGSITDSSSSYNYAKKVYGVCFESNKSGNTNNRGFAVTGYNENNTNANMLCSLYIRKSTTAILYFAFELLISGSLEGTTTSSDSSKVTDMYICY